MFSIKEIIEATDAKIIKNELKDGDYSLSTDTRTIKENQIYLPLKGESFDGEKFVKNALDKGAIGYFTTDKTDFDAKLILKVENTLIAYLKLARFLRRKISPKVVAITGSSGKTTTKEIVNAVLSEKFKTHKTPLNHNNEVGFCQTLFSMPVDTDVLIVEMGMRGLGEIELLSSFAEPDVAIISNVGTAHIGRLGSRKNIAIAKCEITKFLEKEGLLISTDNELVKEVNTYMGKTLYYSIKDAQIIDKKVGISKFIYKDSEYELKVEGNHNIENSIAAIEVGLSLKMTTDEIKKGLLSYKPIEKRWETEIVNGFRIINDSYNANPESTKAAVGTFLELYENPVVVFGDMGELGEDEKKYHREVGQFFVEASKKIENVKFLTVGTLSKETAKELEKNNIFVQSFEKNIDVSEYIYDKIEKNTTIFLKASRSMKLEEIIENLKGKLA